MLASNINISLHRGGVLGIIGGNGTGKTTLLRTLLGEIRELVGRVVWGTKTNIGYYSQTLDDLHAGNEVHAEMRRVAPNVENVEIRSFLARFLFFGEDIEKKVRDLSGGEKGRLALAKLIYSQKNVLILDEPTNHLDIPAREALESALDEYPGTIVTVSHDRFFLDRVASQMLSFEPDGGVIDFNGNYTELHDWKLKSEPGAIATGFLQTPKAKDQKPKTDPLSKNQTQQLQRRITEIESKIPKLEAEVAHLAAEMSRPEIAADFAKLTDITEKHADVETQIKALYEEWEATSQKLT